MLADRSYDTDKIVTYAIAAGMGVVIPPKKNPQNQRVYDRYLQRLPLGGKCLSAFETLARNRHQIRKNTPFLAAVQIRCIAYARVGTIQRSP